MSLSPPERCTVCHQTELRHFLTVRDVPYWRCPQCEATLMDPGCWLDPEGEKRVYELHDNNPDDPGYRQFLNRLGEPLAARLATGSEGLEFGCGPGPALADILQQRGFRVSLYDPFFHPDESALSRSYDFITCTEVVEHLHDPWSVFAQLDRLLKPGGWLGVMTCFQTDDERFANWHYRRDPTHVVFYREQTLAHIARRFGWALVVPVKNVALFHKDGVAS